MLSILLSTASGLLLLIIGYYFGHQIGSTQHIRQELAKLRKNPD